MTFKVKILFVISLELYIISQFGAVHSRIGCFVCSSRNGSNPDCEDPFNPGNMNTTGAAAVYQDICKVPKRKHVGEFPAHFCIKVIGTSYATNERVVVRRCNILTMERHCGNFYLEDELFRGCVLTCQLDGCNSANSPSSFSWLAITSLSIVSLKTVQSYLTNIT